MRVQLRQCWRLRLRRKPMALNLRRMRRWCIGHGGSLWHRSRGRFLVDPKGPGNGPLFCYPVHMDERAALARLVDNPVAFSKGILRHKLWAGQRAILDAIHTHKQVAVKACHGSSKTFTASEALLYWITRYPDGMVITTAPTWFQVKELLWQEVAKAVSSSRINYAPYLNQTELKLGPGNYAIGLSTDETVRFQGFHGAHVLFILDEAPGVRPGIWEAIEGAQSGGDVRVLALGNPTVPSGKFYEAFSRDKAHWHTITIDAFDTPNLRGMTVDDLLALPDDDLLPGAYPEDLPYLVSRAWVRSKYDTWGPLSPLWAARVRGQFPTQGEDSLYSLALLEAAGRAIEQVAPDAPVYAGVDVAGPGEDETVCTIRSGNQILAINGWASPDPRGEVLAMLLPYSKRLINVNVDSIGMGYYFAQHLSDAGIPVTFFNVGEAASDTERFSNLKSETYWGFRDRLVDGAVAGLSDDVAVSQLSSIRYRHNPRGQVTIESKDDARKRGIKSPDRAESVILAFAENNAMFY